MMRRTDLAAITATIALLVAATTAAGDRAQKTADLNRRLGSPTGQAISSPIREITPIALDGSPIDKSATSPDRATSPAAVCDGKWQGPAAFYISGWFLGSEYYAVYQDPLETGCTNTYPFGVTDVHWTFYAQDSLTVHIQPVIYEYLGPDMIGSPLCTGPTYHVSVPAQGVYQVNLPLSDTCCVYGPYYAGVYCSLYFGGGVLDVTVDDGITVPPRGDAAYNDWGTGWQDLVHDMGFSWNLQLWSSGVNSDQNSCRWPDKAIILDTVYGLSPTGKLIAGEDIRFMMRLSYSSGSTIDGFTNGFRIYSPDGATWQRPVIDTVSLGWPQRFDLGVFLSNSAANGSGADTVGIGAAIIFSSGIAAPFDGRVWWIETQVLESDSGKHLCVDSSLYPPFNPWLWSTTSGAFVPQWSGLRCFEIAPPCCNGDGLRGNADDLIGPAGEVDIADLTYVVAYLFQGGPPPPCVDEGNADGFVGPGGEIDVADLTYLVAYLFQGGSPPPPCP